MRWTKLSVILAFASMSLHPGLCQTSSTNEAVAKFYFEEVVNRQRLEGLNKVFADTFLVHSLLDSTETRKTITDQSDFLKYLFKAFPDIHYTIGDILEAGNRIVMRVMFSGTHKGEFWGYPASGNHIRYLSEIFFFRFSNGKIAETWVQLDLYDLFKQLQSAK
ncbi:MAG TPA: ester cyclase [Puia sp.]|jgi:steroid delta-isomerase-like uncharacterized protein|nr:ester cyclase [Puia sp.]